MTLNDYLSHYIEPRQMGMFVILAIAGALICNFVVIIVVAIKSTSVPKPERQLYFYEKSHNTIQRFYEMIFSGASILSFLAIYYLIDRFITAGAFRTFWDRYKDFLLLLMICLSCVFNSYLDKMLIPLKKVSQEETSSVRLNGMLYVLLIFFYIKFIYENNNYDGFIMYFLGLMIGRFIYFDASLADSFKTLKAAARNLPLLVLGLTYTGFMCYIGFTADYLLTSNGVLVSTFIAHIFMIAAIFLVHHTHFMSIFARKPKSMRRQERIRRRRRKYRNDTYSNESYDEEAEYEDTEYDDDNIEYPSVGEYDDDELDLIDISEDDEYEDTKSEYYDEYRDRMNPYSDSPDES